jgi:flagellar FliL protein
MADSEKKSSGGKGPFLLLVVSVINLAGVGAVGYALFQMSQKMRDMAVVVKAVRETAATAQANEAATSHRETSGTSLAPMGVLYPMESFLVNVHGDVGSKYLQTQMELELSDADLQAELVRKRPALRDAVIVLLSSKTVKELREPDTLKTLRSQIVQSLNQLLTTGKIKEVYFTQFHFN